MYCRIHCLNSFPILELSVKFVSQIYHENINTPLDGTYSADFGIDVRPDNFFHLGPELFISLCQHSPIPSCFSKDFSFKVKLLSVLQYTEAHNKNVVKELQPFSLIVFMNFSNLMENIDMVYPK